MENDNLRTIRIETNGQFSVKHWRFFLEDKDISHMIRNIKITVGVDHSLPKVEIEWIVRPDFPDEFKAEVISTLYDPMKIKEVVFDGKPR